MDTGWFGWVEPQASHHGETLTVEQLDKGSATHLWEISPVHAIPDRGQGWHFGYKEVPLGTQVGIIM